MRDHSDWTFAQFLEEIFHLSEIIEIPGVAAQKADLIKEMWGKFPNECKALGLTDGLKNSG